MARNCSLAALSGGLGVSRVLRSARLLLLQGGRASTAGGVRDWGGGDETQLQPLRGAILLVYI